MPTTAMWTRLGLEPAQMEAHLDRLRSPATPTRLFAACSVGHGLHPLPEATTAVAEAARDGRVQTFVPASGAATRMFQAVRQAYDAGVTSLDDLRHRVQAGERDLAPALRAFEGWSGLALSQAVACQAPAPEQDLQRLLTWLVDSGWLDRPKGLVPFHVVDGGWHTPVHGHLLEAAALGADRVGCVHVHFTAPTAHLAPFREAAQAAADTLDADVRLHLSVQDPATDTPALEVDGRPVVDDDVPLLRPAGHGALLANLPGDADLLLIKNIDNVGHPDHRPALVQARRGLLQALLDLEREHHAHVAAVTAGTPGATAAAREWLAQEFGLSGVVARDPVLDDLHRPLRVAGMVPNDGHPGGGPFWVVDTDGRVSCQIVEGVEVDHDDPDQERLWRASTHFNPVDLACSVRDASGQPYDLSRYVDDTRWIVTTKVHRGRPVRCLERPGLWNGSMAGWLTRFVMLPRSCFTPVKTVADLLNPEHRPAS